MKILQLVQKPQRRGAEVFAFQLSDELRGQGHQVQTIYLYAHQNGSSLPLQPHDIQLGGRETHPAEALLGVQPRLLGRLRQAIADFQPDVVQVNGGRAVKYGAFSRYLRQNGLGVLIYRNIGHPRDWVTGWQRRLLYQKVIMPQIDGVIGVSQLTLQAVREFYGLTIPTAFVPNGVDPHLAPQRPAAVVRQQTNTGPEAPVILFVGSLAPEKRVDRLLRAVVQVRRSQPQVCLWLVGDGPERASLEQQAVAFNLAEQVRFLGVQADVASYMGAADLLALTSDTEGIPAVILEAGLLGLPVVATQVGGLPECVLDGQTGRLVPPQDEQALARIIADLLSDQDQRRWMGENAKQWIKSQFTMDIIAQKYCDFYRQVLTREQSIRPAA